MQKRNAHESISQVHTGRPGRICKVLLRLGLAGMSAIAAAGQAYTVTNLVSDGSVPATTTDANFLNPWGVSASPNWWISTAGSGFNYVVPAAATIAFKVIVPLGAQTTTPGLPSGAVTATGSTGFLLPNGTAPSFIFSTLDGTISGWNSKLGTNNAVSQIVVNNSGSGAAYTGLALLNTASGSFLLAPNFTTAAVEVYGSDYKPAKLAGSFTDPNLPANYAPYSINILGTQIFVAYALRTATLPYRSVSAAGAGILDVYDTTGAFVARAVTGGNLNAPWGVAFAPANFGIYSNDLLVGNFGDGKINVYDPKAYNYIGQLMDVKGNALSYASLWALLTGGTKVTGTTAVSAGDVNTVYFTAGLDSEKHGLLGGIANTTVAGSTPTFGFSAGAGAATVTAGSSLSTPISLAPVNGFNGVVNLSCSGLPANSTCSFAPSQVTVSSTAVTLASMTIATTGKTAALHIPSKLQGRAQEIAVACMLPFAGLLLVRRKRPSSAPLQLLCAVFLLGGCALLVTGCGDDASPTPAGQTKVTIAATSGTVTQQTTLALTVQ